MRTASPPTASSTAAGASRSSPRSPPPASSAARQVELGLDDADRTADEDGQQYELMRMIESVRHSVGEWRRLPRAQWRVTPETARLLDHWRHHQFSDIRPFFCQVEPRTGAARHARRPELVGQDRHHHLHAFMPRATQDISRGGRHAGVEAADAAARDARPLGHDAHSGVRRRSTNRD